MTSSGAYPPGVTDNDPHFDSASWNDEPPQQWVECSACGGEGQVFSHMHGSCCSGAIDPPFEVYEACPKCNGEGRWLEDAHDDDEDKHCPYRHFTEEEEAGWERVFAGIDENGRPR